MGETEVRRRVCMVVIFGVLAFGAGLVRAGGTRTFTVNTTSDSVVLNACENRGAGCSLRGAMGAAHPAGDAVIRFSIPPTEPGCFAGSCTISLNSSLPIILAPNISINGPGANRLTIRATSGVNLPVFQVSHESGTVTISDLTVTEGAGGFFMVGEGSLNIVGVYLLGNLRTDGGAILAARGTTNVVRSTIALNTANGEGGGIKVNTLATCNIVNSTIALNESVSVGGGLYNEGTLSIQNSTIFGNEAFGGGGIANSGNATVRSSIIASNVGAAGPHDVSGTFSSSGFNLIGRVTGSTGFTAATDTTGTNASPLDPRLGDLRDHGGALPTIRLLSDSPAIDKGSAAAGSTTDQRGGAFGRTRDNPLIPNASSGDGTDIGAYERHTMSTFDFDGDVKTDIGIFRPTDGTWWVNRSLTGATFVAGFGNSSDKMVPADYTGDGKADIAIWRPSTGQWFVLRSEDSSFFAFPFGMNGDVPDPADFDDDGRADAAVFRASNSTWFIQRSIGGTTIQQFGASGDVPVAADYDGDGHADIAIYRPSNGQWWLNRSVAGVLTVTFGTSTDKPTPGDFTGDGKTDVAIFRPSTGQWFVLRSENFSFFGFPFGTFGDLPAAGDYDGDGKVDAVVFRPSNATWFIQRSAGGTTIAQFGANGDRPTANAFVP